MTLVMRALSIRQPWLHAILNLGKCVENRAVENFHYRGPILLHASTTHTRRRFASQVNALQMARADIGVAPASVPSFAALPSGLLCGIARVVGVLQHPTSGVARVQGYDGVVRELDWSRGYLGYRIAGELGLELADVRELPAVPYKGMLGLFSVALGHTPHRTAYEEAWRELDAATRRST